MSEPERVLARESRGSLWANASEVRLVVECASQRSNCALIARSS